MSLKMRSVISIVAILFVFVLGLFGLGTSVKAEATLQCTNQSLRGSYASYNFGFLDNGKTPVAFQALDIFDGNGNVKGTKGVTSTAGKIDRNQSFTGTYQVNSDCTANLNFTDNKTGDKFSVYGIVIGNGRKITDLDTDAGTTIFGMIERVH